MVMINQHSLYSKIQMLPRVCSVFHVWTSLIGYYVPHLTLLRRLLRLLRQRVKEH